MKFFFDIVYGIEGMKMEFMIMDDDFVWIFVVFLVLGNILQVFGGLF